jgi:hypothetical protein
VAQPQQPAGLGKQTRDVARAVVAHHPLDPDAEALEPAQRPDQEAGHRLTLFVGQDLDVGQPGGIVDRDVDELVADLAVLAAPLAGDAMAAVAKAGELLDVEVDELTGAGALVTSRWRAWFERRPATEAEPREVAGHGAARELQTPICSPVMRDSHRRRTAISSQGAGSLLATRWGAELRFCRPAWPSLRKRASHLRTVRTLTSKASAAAATLQPSSSTRRTITARPKGVVRAF